MFKKMRGVRLKYNEQGEIYFHCKQYAKRTPEEREVICEVCRRVCGGNDTYYRALMRVLTTEYGVRRVAIDEEIGERTLYKLRQKFYEEFARVR